MVEGLIWSRLPLQAGDQCAELGSAPGGAAQALLERRLTVLGIDPAEMDPALLSQPDLTHVRKRAMDMKRREFRHVKWLFADSNVAPKYTLDAVEAIVTHREVHVQGMLLTLKLLDWSLAQQIPDYVARVHSWGFDRVQTRQLAFNRREICLAALRHRG
jgi:23S rRNA (cytidine2498-2'-O)-methyltransferase